VACRLDRLDTPYSTDVVGKLTNESGSALTVVLLGATFFNQDGRIVGTASGAVNAAHVHEPRTGELSVAWFQLTPERPTDHDRPDEPQHVVASAHKRSFQDELGVARAGAGWTCRGCGG
jgi:hypothetical protein